MNFRNIFFFIKVEFFRLTLYSVENLKTLLYREKNDPEVLFSNSTIIIILICFLPFFLPNYFEIFPQQILRI